MQISNDTLSLLGRTGLSPDSTTHLDGASNSTTFTLWVCPILQLAFQLHDRFYIRARTSRSTTSRGRASATPRRLLSSPLELRLLPLHALIAFLPSSTTVHALSTARPMWKPRRSSLPTSTTKGTSTSSDSTTFAPSFPQRPPTPRSGLDLEPPTPRPISVDASNSTTFALLSRRLYSPGGERRAPRAARASNSTTFVLLSRPSSAAKSFCSLDA